MNRILIASLTLLTLAVCTENVHAQRGRIAPTYRPAPVRAYEPAVSPSYSSSGSSYSSTGGYSYTSSDSSSYSSSSSDESSSGDNFRLICMVIILASIVIRLICGIIGFFVWIFRGILG